MARKIRGKERKKGHDIMYWQRWIKKREERKVGEKQTVNRARRHGMSACLSFPITGSVRRAWIDLRIQHLLLPHSPCLIKNYIVPSEHCAPVYSVK